MLWEWAWEYGAVNALIPYVNRPLLFVAAWHPVATNRPVRGHSALDVATSFTEETHIGQAPRFAACMKETPSQRTWPAHARRPTEGQPGPYRCQYPGCEMVFVGPRHRRLCDEHTSSRLPPSRQLKRIGDP